MSEKAGGDIWTEIGMCVADSFARMIISQEAVNKGLMDMYQGCKERPQNLPKRAKRARGLRLYWF